MSISPSKARALCTESEYNLVKWSSPKNVKTLTPAKLKDKIDRARKLRDKFRDLAKKQSGEARGKRKPTGTRPAQGNERTVMKAELFDQTLSRFQKALEQAEASEGKSDKSGRKTSKKSTAKSAGKASASGESASSSGVAKKPAKGKSAAKSASAKKAAAKESGAKQSKPPVDPARAAMLLAAPAGSLRLGGATSLGLGVQRNTFSQSTSQTSGSQQSRETRRREASQTSKIGREQNRFSRTAREKIQGHVSAATRRSQAKRDSKGG